MAANRFMAYQAEIAALRNPGQWLRRRVGNGPTHFGVRTADGLRLPSGATYDTRRDGWRRVGNARSHFPSGSEVK